MTNEKIVIITGISGAGKSTALKCLEDLGYFCIDNMPIDYISHLLETFSTKKHNENFKKIAFELDIREHHLSQNFAAIIKRLKNKKYNFKIIFLDADDQIIIRRFSETRRKHPLTNELGNATLLSSILEERKLLDPIKKMSNKIINSSNLNEKKLKAMITHIFLNSADKLIINLVSFGFKYGVPIDTDMLFDVRFLPNPYYHQELKPLNGNDLRIQKFVMSIKPAKIFLNHLKDIFDFLIPEFEKEGKTYLTIGIGCTGGKHRSVTIINKLKEYLINKNLNVAVIHRDIEK